MRIDKKTLRVSDQDRRLDADLYHTVSRYARSRAIRFHMPGHSGKKIGLSTRYDITELSFSDNLLDGNGIICESEQKIARCYGAKHALMLTGGATGAVAIALATLAVKGQALQLLNTAHRSVYAWAEILGMTVYEPWETPHKPIAATIVTSPDYFGNIYPTPKSYEGKLIVDESHGAAFVFSKLLPDSAANTCDILISSWHKTLPVLTGGAVIVCNDDALYGTLRDFRSRMHSTSPNYMVMTSMDRARALMQKNGERLYANVLRKIDRFSCCLDKSRFEILPNDDRTRLCVSLKGIDAYGFAKELEKKNVWIEAAYEDLLVLIVTPYNVDRLKRFSKTLRTVNHCQTCVKSKTEKERFVEAFSDVEWIVPEESEGRIAARTVGIYPPGTPLIRSGERIGDETAARLCACKSVLFGTVDGKICVGKEKT